jgi:integrase
MAKEKVVDKMILVDPGNPKYRGVYIRYSGVAGAYVGTFYIYYRVDGKNKWEKVGTDLEGFNKTACMELRGKRLHEIKMGEYHKVADKLTMNDAFVNWVKWASINLTNEGKGNTYRVEESRYNNHIRPIFGATPIAKITPQMLERAKAKWLKKIQKQTIRNVMSLMSRIINRNTKLGYYTGDNPMKEVDKFQSENQRLRWFTKAEAEEVLLALMDRDTDAYFMACFGLYAGLRPIEVQRLKWWDLDRDRRLIKIKHVKHSKKTNKNRSVNSTRQLHDAIEQLKMHRGEYKPTDLIFPRWKERVFRQIFAPYNKGLDPYKDKADWVSFYTFRHTFGSFLAEAGVPLKTIQIMMGHDRIQTTEIYAKVGPESAERATEILSDIWDS